VERRGADQLVGTTKKLPRLGSAGATARGGSDVVSVVPTASGVASCCAGGGCVGWPLASGHSGPWGWPVTAADSGTGADLDHPATFAADAGRKRCLSTPRHRLHQRRTVWWLPT